LKDASQSKRRKKAGKKAVVRKPEEGKSEVESTAIDEVQKGRKDSLEECIKRLSGSFDEYDQEFANEALKIAKQYGPTWIENKYKSAVVTYNDSYGNEEDLEFQMERSRICSETPGKKTKGFTLLSCYSSSS
jgi:hypothetical protein